MYQLTITADGVALRSSPSLSVRKALRSWHEEECTGYVVLCHDELGATVTKAQLRDVLRHP